MDSSIVFLVVIINRKNKEIIIEELNKDGAHFFNIIYGKGSVRCNTLFNALGLVIEQNKVIITSLIKKEKADIIIDLLNTKYHFTEPNTGIAFTVKVDQIEY